MGSEDWIQCFSIEKAGAVEVLGDCVPSEGDYRFRICTVSGHGRSPHVVFHGSAHLGELVLPDPPITSPPFPSPQCWSSHRPAIRQPLPSATPSSSDSCTLSLPQCPQLAWWQVWRMCRYTTGKMPSSPSISPPSSRVPGSLMGKSSRVTSRRARWNLGPCGTVWSRRVCSTDSSCMPSSTRTAVPWSASAAPVCRTQLPSQSKVGANGDLSGQKGSRHRSPVGKMRQMLFLFLVSGPGEQGASMMG